MTTKVTKKNSAEQLGWFKSLVEQLKPSNLTKPQKANLLLDAIGAICFIILVFSTKEDCWKVVSFFGILVFGTWCHSRSAPQSK